MCVCVMCECVCTIYACVCADIYPWGQRASGSFVCHCLPYLLETGSLIEPEVRHAASKPQWLSCLHPSWCLGMPGFFTWNLNSGLHEYTTSIFTLWAISPGPLVGFKNKIVGIKLAIFITQPEGLPSKESLLSCFSVRMNVSGLVSTEGCYA